MFKYYMVTEHCQIVLKKHPLGDVFIVCPLKGLTIMNQNHQKSKNIAEENRFRPQQGLLVINVFPYFLKEVVCCEFPSPTGVNHYE